MGFDGYLVVVLFAGVQADGLPFWGIDEIIDVDVVQEFVVDTDLHLSSEQVGHSVSGGLSFDGVLLSSGQGLDITSLDSDQFNKVVFGVFERSKQVVVHSLSVTIENFIESLGCTHVHQDLDSIDKGKNNAPYNYRLLGCSLRPRLQSREKQRWHRSWCSWRQSNSFLHRSIPNRATTWPIGTSTQAWLGTKFRSSPMLLPWYLDRTNSGCVPLCHQRY